MAELVNVKHTEQPWIRSCWFDCAFVLSPAFLSILWAMIYQSKFPEVNQVSTLAWVILIVGIDVSHVYSTLYRTYLDPVEFKKRSTLYTLVPILGWTVAAILYSVSSMAFWRVLAYLAVFHFIRQQYGFMRIYCRKEEPPQPVFRYLDHATIYAATLYPLIYWHCHLPRNFHWFIDGDFISLSSTWLIKGSFAVYLALLSAYAIKEVVASIMNRKLNIPKNLIVVGTALSWYLGIIHYNGDLAFTVTNVVSHGIPYIALIWLYGRRKYEVSPARPPGAKIFNLSVYSLEAIPIFIGILLLASYLEEGLWDGFVWRDHVRVFSVFAKLPRLQDESLLAWIVPLLALPQITHYILDGFIWKIRGTQDSWQGVMFQERAEL